MTVSQVLVLLDAVTSSTTGPTVRVPVVGRDLGWLAHLGGAGGFGSVTLQGSYDSAIWFSLASTGDPARGLVTEPVQYLRVVYDDQGLTGPVTVQALQSDEDG